MQQIIQIRPGSASSVLSGDKVMTIQKGRRIYNLGCTILLDPQDSFTIPVQVLRVSYCEIKDVPVSDYVVHGEKSWKELLDYLKQYYPDIKNDSTITIVRYKMKKQKNCDENSIIEDNKLREDRRKVEGLAVVFPYSELADTPGEREDRQIESINVRIAD